MNHALRCSALVTLCAAAAAQSTSWSQLQSANRPPARANHDMFFDEVRQTVVLFGGTLGLGAGAFGDMWEWDGADWRRIALPPGAGPSPRHSHTIAYDPPRQRALLHGGYEYSTGSSVPAADTWSWDGASWQRVGLNGPTNFFNRLVMVYDAPNDDMLLVFAAGLTWRWVGATGTWQQIVSSGPQMVGTDAFFDPASGRPMVRRYAPSGPSLPEIWQWDGSQWQLMSLPAGPVPGRGRTVGHPHRGRSVVVAPEVLGGTPQTWEWDGATWSALATNTPPVEVMAYDAARAVLVAFGADTFEFRTLQPAQLTPLGNGCAGSNGVPVLTPDSPGPWLGCDFSVRVDDLPAPAIAALQTSIQVIAPIPLDSLGMPGCTAFVGPGLTSLMTTTGTSAVASFLVPPLPALIGVAFRQQALVLDPGHNALGAVVTQALDGVIGLR